MAWQKGQSGNPGGRKRTNPEVREMAEAACPDAIKRVISFLEDSDPKIAMMAANILLDRGLGKPVQAMEHGGPGGEGLEVVIRNFVLPREGG